MPELRVVLVTGASSGIGKACAEHLRIYGYRVIAASRSSAIDPLDVTSDESVVEAVRRVIEAEGRIDAVINNAGIGIAGAVEDTTPQEALLQFETNFFGVLRVTRAALPHMRRQGGGRIINIGSIGGLIAIPYQGLYSASKFALEGFTEALRLEVRQFGIEASIIEPGDHKTAMTANRILTAGAGTGSVYQKPFERAIARMAEDEQSGPDPVEVARLARRVLEARRPRLRYTTGPALQRAAAMLKRIAPSAAMEWAIEMYYS